MTAKLIVVLGAGASHDASGRRSAGRERPPLVAHLFSEGGLDDSILSAYPLAETAGAEIRHAANNAVGLEQTLKERYRDSGSEHDRRVFFQVPLYLQHRLLVASNAFVPDAYNRLIMATLRLQEVIFVTLNYDLLLDQRLREFSPLNSLDSYISQERNWSLIKLHGSVNWAKELRTGLETLGGGHDPPFYARTFDRFALSAETEPEFVLRPVDPQHAPSLADTRVDSYENSLYYPALSVPLGPDDELSCPDSHVEFFKASIEDREGLHLLFIGYSGYDVEVMRLLRESSGEFKSVTMVNPDDSAERRIIEGLGRYPRGRVWPLQEGFTAFVVNGHLEQLLESLD